jgi:hypothetical protein
MEEVVKYNKTEFVSGDFCRMDAVAKIVTEVTNEPEPDVTGQSMYTCSYSVGVMQATARRSVLKSTVSASKPPQQLRGNLVL